jgi:DHA2 family multidrug resistance protein
MSNPALSASISALPSSSARSERIAIDPDRASIITWIAVIAAMIGSFMAILNIQITNASLLNIEGGIGTGVDNGSWISTSYLIGEIIVIPLTDFLSRVFSFRRYMLASASLFAAFSVACAFTHDLPSMIAMRGLQGFAGGVLIPMAFTLVLTKLPKPQQPIGLAIFALSVTFAPAIGPTIGGYLTENYGWRTIFFVNVLPTIVMVSALYLTLERQPMQLKLLKEGDWAGIATMAVGLSALQTVLEEGNKDDWFSSPFIQRLAVVALVSLSLFIWIEFTTAKPLIRLRRHRIDHAGLRAVRIGLHPAGLSRPGAGLQCRTDRRRAGLDRPAPAPADSFGPTDDAALRHALHRRCRAVDLCL